MGGVARVRWRIYGVGSSPRCLWRDARGGRSSGNSSSASIRVAGDRWAMAVSVLLLADLLLAGHFLNSGVRDWWRQRAAHSHASGAADAAARTNTAQATST